MTNTFSKQMIISNELVLEDKYVRVRDALYAQAVREGNFNVVNLGASEHEVSDLESHVNNNFQVYEADGFASLTLFEAGKDNAKEELRAQPKTFVYALSETTRRELKDICINPLR